MATQEVILRPGDSISVLLDVPGQPLRLDLSLTPNGVAVSGALPLGAPTLYGGPLPPRSAMRPDDEVPDEAIEEIDLTDEFSEQDSEQKQAPQSLAAVSPFSEPTMQAVDVPFDDMEEVQDEPAVVEESASAGDDLDLDLGDFEEEHVEVGAVDVPEDDGALMEVPEDDGGFGGPVEIPEEDEGLALDIPEDDAPGLEDSGFSADAMTMVPPTRKHSAPALSLSESDGSLSIDGDMDDMEIDEHGNPKAKFRPNPEDTLPVWTGKARTYKDPEVEKKKETSKINKSAPGKPGAPSAKPAAKPITGAVKPAAAAKPAPAAAPGPAKLPPGKKPITKQIKKPGAAEEGDGNFTVFLSPPKGADKKQAAAEIIADIQGIDVNAAMQLAGKMIVPVVKGVSEGEANSIRDRFKDAGLSCRITQKR
ncbi:MAG: hypothetical protein IPK87_03910 [Planctomycetes bacterium]|nr:hypothetical protein [Planctomycetota bacterium]